MIVNDIKREAFSPALALVWKVFLEFEAPDYTEQGVLEFEKSISDTAYLDMLRMYGAYEGETLIGVLATRSGGSHIALFFVDAGSQRRGVGRALFARALADCGANRLTVNSSPFAVEIYGRLGFKAVAPEQTTNGLRYTPMELALPE